MSNWDVTLAGQNYMLVPGSYRAFPDGYVDSRLGRQRLADFASGQGHPRPTRSGETRGGLLVGLAAWPAPWPSGAHGIGPAPVRQAVSGTINTNEPKLAAADDDYLYIVTGTTVFRWARSVATAPVNRKTLAAAATCMVRLNDVLWIGHGAAADVSKYDDTTNVLTASALGAGVKASMLATFSRAIVLVDPAFPMNLHVYYGSSLTYVRTWALDGVILNLVQHGDTLIVATDGGLHRLSGEWYQDVDPPAPPESLRLTSWGTLSGQLQDDDDFAWLTVYQGRLMAWLGKRVVVFDETRGWWRHAGLEGGATTGAAVVNGWLLVSLSPRAASSTYQLWGYNGAGWWLLDEVATTNTLAFPAGDGGGKLVTFQAGSNTLGAYDLDDVATAANLASPFSVTTPLLDGGDPDQRKYWRRVGVELARLDGQPVGDWSVALAYSADGGTTWTNAGSAVSVTSELASVDAAIAATSSGLLLRATVTRTSGLPPFISAIWAEYETLNESVRRRRWQFRVHARARGVNRAGELDGRTGQQIRAALWSLWDDASTFAFRDVDYAADPTERTVRMIGLREEWPKPADQTDLGADSTLEITLVEV